MKNNIRYLIETLESINNTRYYYVYWPYSYDFLIEDDAFLITKSDTPDIMVPVEMFEDANGYSKKGRIDTKYVFIDWPSAKEFYENPEAIFSIETNGIFIPENFIQ